MRIYGRWAGNPTGQAERIDRCIAQVQIGSSRAPYLYWQCPNLRGFGEEGLFCPQHANDPQAWVPDEE